MAARSAAPRPSSAPPSPAVRSMACGNKGWGGCDDGLGETYGWVSGPSGTACALAGLPRGAAASLPAFWMLVVHGLSPLSARSATVPLGGGTGPSTGVSIKVRREMTNTIGFTLKAPPPAPVTSHRLESVCQGRMELCRSRCGVKHCSWCALLTTARGGGQSSRTDRILRFSY